MNKIYRITLIFLLLILFLSNIVFFAYGGQFLSYFKVEAELESPQSIINKARISMTEELEDARFFDLDILEDNKYKNLKDFKVDLSEFILPGDLLPSEEGGEMEEEREPEFEIGNPNPFRPLF